MKRLALLGLLLVAAVPASAAHLPIVATQDWWPVVSTDSVHVAFTRVEGRTFRLFVANRLTRTSVPVGTSASQLGPTWSSDGRLAYSSGGVIYITTANGSDKHAYPDAPAKAFAPAWRPGSEEIAYLTTHGATNTDLWVGGELWAKDAIGTPSWSPDGTKLAFARTSGIYVTTGPGVETKVASTTTEPGSPAFDVDGQLLAYSAGGFVYVVAPGGTPKRIAGPFADVGPIAWGSTNDQLAFSTRSGLVLATNEPTWHTAVAAKAPVGPGASFAPGVPRSEELIYSSPRTTCPGHLSLRSLGDPQTITGSCAILGTAGNDVIDGTPEAGDAVVAGSGNDQIHVNDGHRDTVNCGAGRDTVWADKADELVGCEVVHR